MLTWGMRVTATCILILGAIAVVSLATTGKFQFGALRGSARTINADLGGWGLALVILGIGSVLLGSSLPQHVERGGEESRSPRPPPAPDALLFGSWSVWLHSAAAKPA